MAFSEQLRSNVFETNQHGILFRYLLYLGLTRSAVRVCRSQAAQPSQPVLGLLGVRKGLALPPCPQDFMGSVELRTTIPSINEASWQLGWAPAQFRKKRLRPSEERVDLGYTGRWPAGSQGRERPQPGAQTRRPALPHPAPWHPRLPCESPAPPRAHAPGALSHAPPPPAGTRPYRSSSGVPPLPGCV